MSEDLNQEFSPDELRASQKAKRREQKRQEAKSAPVVNRYGVWTGEKPLREGEGLERFLAEKTVKPPPRLSRGKKRRRRK